MDLGSGKGTSIKSIINLLEKISGEKMKIEFCQRRKGDPSCLYADISKAQKILHWQPEFSNLNNILLTYVPC